MRLRLPWFVAALALVAGPAKAAAPSPPVPVTNHVEMQYDVQADGQYSATIHIRRTAGDAAGAASLRQLPWQYSPSREKVQVVSAYVLKANGDKLPVSPNAIQDRPSPDRFSDARSKLIPFYNIAPGDSVVVELHDTVFKPRLPGVFSLGLVYGRGEAWDATVTVNVPDGVTLQSEAVGPQVVDDGSDQTYSWHYKNDSVLAEDPGVLAPVTRLPRLVVTTAKDWTQIGRLYASLALPQAKVTPAVQKAADAAAATGYTQREIATKLFDWVRDTIHFHAEPLGQGDITPLPADKVLADKSGDSADEAVLLKAMLAAKGIDSDLVLIDTDSVYRLSVPAPFVQLNHVLLYLPQFSAYADPTVAFSEIGMLPFGAYGKPAVFAVPTGEVRRTIPVLTPDAATLDYDSTAHIASQGMIEGDSVTTATGPFAVSLLLAAHLFAAPDSGNRPMQQLQASGEIGTGGFRFPPTIGRGGVVLPAHYAISLWPQLTPDNRLALPEGLRLQPRAGDLLIGALGTPLPATVPTPCFAGRETETISLDVGPGYRVTQLPADTTIDDPAFQYKTHWSVVGSIITVRRALISRLAVPVCEGKTRAAAAAALLAIGADYGARVALQPVATGANATNAGMK